MHASTQIAKPPRFLGTGQIAPPFDGVVAEIYKNGGEWVEQGSAVCRLVSLDRLRAEGFVSPLNSNPEDLLEKPVVIEVMRAHQQKETFAGIIKFVSPVVESSGEFRVSAEFDNRKTSSGFWVARPGMDATMTIATAADASATNNVSGRLDSNYVDKAKTAYHETEIEYLEELETIATRTYLRVKALYDAGAPGGQAENEAATRHQMCIAKARLALVKQDWEECLKQYEAAVNAANKEVEAYEAAFDAGTVTLDVFLDAQRRRAEAKLELHQTKRNLQDH